MAKRGRRLDGSVPGIEFKQYRGGSNPSLFDGHPQNDLPHPQHVYDPHPGAMDQPDAGYDQYTCEMPQQRTPMLRFDPVERPPAQVEPTPSYEDGVQLQEVFNKIHATSFVTEPGPAAEPDVPPAHLEELAGEAFSPDPTLQMASELEQFVEDHLEAAQPPDLLPEEPDPYPQMMDPFAMPDPFSPSM